MATCYSLAIKRGKYLLVFACLISLVGCYRNDDENAPTSSLKTFYYKKVGQSYFAYTFAQGEYPEYRDGGYAGFLENVYDHVEYPKQAEANLTEGRVIIYYVLKPDGTVSEAIIIEDIGDGCGEAASEAVLKALKGQPFDPSNRIDDIYGIVRVYFELS